MPWSSRVARSAEHRAGEPMLSARDLVAGRHGHRGIVRPQLTPERWCETELTMRLVLSTGDKQDQGSGSSSSRRVRILSCIFFTGWHVMKPRLLPFARGAGASGSAAWVGGRRLQKGQSAEAPCSRVCITWKVASVKPAIV